MRFPLILIPHNLKIDFLKQKKYAFAFSLAITMLTFAMIGFRGLNFGIDFVGGIMIEVHTNTMIEDNVFRNLLTENGYHGSVIQSDKNSNYFIRLRPQLKDSNEIDIIKDLFHSKISKDIEFRKIEYVGPKIGKELAINSVVAVVLALIVMKIYTWLRFNWQFGLGVIVALLHDIIATLGFYSISNLEFDIGSIAAILTIVGYSINDSVVIYDRIRENLRKYKSKSVSDVINLSINETLSRTVMTVATTAVACLSLVLFGGPVIQGFSIVMLFGIIFGTYSSIYISAPILMLFNNSKLKV